MSAEPPPEPDASAEPTPELVIPKGFPAKLDDDELKAKTAEIAEHMGVFATGHGATIMTALAPLHEIGRSELFQRSLVDTEQRARLALWVAAISVIVSVIVGGGAIVVSFRDSTADRVVDVRVELKQQRAILEQQRAILEQIRDRLATR